MTRLTLPTAFEMYFLESPGPKLGSIFRSGPCILERKCSLKLLWLKLIYHSSTSERHTLSKMYKAFCTRQEPFSECQDSGATRLLGTPYKSPRNLSEFLCVNKSPLVCECALEAIGQLIKGSCVSMAKSPIIKFPGGYWYWPAAKVGATPAWMQLTAAWNC